MGVVIIGANLDVTQLPFSGMYIKALRSCHEVSAFGAGSQPAIPDWKGS
jgi:hypothetical protein